MTPYTNSSIRRSACALLLFSALSGVLHDECRGQAALEYGAISAQTAPTGGAAGLQSAAATFQNAADSLGATHNGAPIPHGAAGRPTLQTNTVIGPQEGLIQRITEPTQRLEMFANTSRILTLDHPMPRVHIANGSVLSYMALSPTQLQISALAPGVTQVNLWDTNNDLYTVEVVVLGDTRELAELLQNEFPTASLRLRAVASGVLISGYVENADQIPRIISIAEEFYPRVIQNIQIGGVNQVLLHVKIIEVSRTKLESFGFDWWHTSAGGGAIAQDAANILGSVDWTTATPLIGGNATLGFHISDGLGTFYGVVEALCEDNVAKVLAEPTLVTYNGRPARFLAGGQVPVQSGGGLGVPTNVEYRDYGTQLDFVPIVLGDGRIRLEVRPQVSEIDEARSIGGNPAFKVRSVETGLELKAGQTLAIAGILETLSEAERRGIPFVSDVPYLGALFRHVQTRQNEVELLVLVTPELVSAMDPEQVPACGPGMSTQLPSTWELMAHGYIEVPACCTVCNGAGCAECQGLGYNGEVAPGEEPGMIGSPNMPAISSGPGVLRMEEISVDEAPRASSMGSPAPMPSRRPQSTSIPAPPSSQDMRRPATWSSSDAPSNSGAAPLPPPPATRPSTPNPTPTPAPMPTPMPPREMPSSPSNSSVRVMELPSLDRTAPTPPTRNAMQRPTTADDIGMAAAGPRRANSFDMYGGPSDRNVAPAGYSPSRNAAPLPSSPRAGSARIDRQPSAPMPAPMPGMMGPVGYDSARP